MERRDRQALQAGPATIKEPRAATIGYVIAATAA